MMPQKKISFREKYRLPIIIGYVFFGFLCISIIGIPLFIRFYSWVDKKDKESLSSIHPITTGEVKPTLEPPGEGSSSTTSKKGEAQPTVIVIGVIAGAPKNIPTSFANFLEGILNRKLEATGRSSLFEFKVVDSRESAFKAESCCLVNYIALTSTARISLTEELEKAEDKAKMVNLENVPKVLGIICYGLRSTSVPFTDKISNKGCLKYKFENSKFELIGSTPNEYDAGKTLDEFIEIAIDCHAKKCTNAASSKLS